MISNPRITVATVVEQEGRFLLVEEISNGKIVFNQPAGHLEEGEEMTEGALRETLEETAWQVEITDFLGVYIMPMASTNATYYRFCYIAKPVTLTSAALDKEIVAAHWLTYEEILQRRDRLRSPMVLRCIEDYRSGRRLPIETVQAVNFPLER